MKIAVCHGKSCTSKGASSIKKILEQKYNSIDTEIRERECCGRCEHSCTIVVDGQPISDLSASTVQERFINDPCKAIAQAHQKDIESKKKLDNALNDLF